MVRRHLWHSIKIKLFISSQNLWHLSHPMPMDRHPQARKDMGTVPDLPGGWHGCWHLGTRKQVPTGIQHPKPSTHTPHPSQHSLLSSTDIFCCAFLNQRQGQGSGLSAHPQGGPAAAEDELSTRWAERATTFWKPWKPGQRLLRFPSGSFST